ncbi:MAG: phosphoribosylamine--glycine ligase [Desulfobacterales bacterium]|nr:phosphoribosylamine--glycine ligase [Desulfobacterales bacterium]
MKVLVIGSGGREHALVWKISKSPKVKTVYAAPGNAGISEIALCVSIASDDIEALLNFAKEEKIDLTVVGPEAPLSKGIVDKFEKEGLKIFGPTQKASEIEYSKSFAKKLMLKYGIPTAKASMFTSYEEAKACLNKKGVPVVIKADGLAAGKGVIVCKSIKEAESALNDIMVKKIFGNAGEIAIIEDFLTGEEASFMAFTDGKTVIPLPSSQDHKAIYDNDEGPNTGGMGAYSPAPVVDRYFHKKIMNEIMIPTVTAMAKEGRLYKGILYAGVMISKDQINVLEFNCRMGDPETQPLLFRIKSDIVDVMDAVCENRLSGCKIDIDDRASVCVVMASSGYPNTYKKGMIISGLNELKSLDNVVVFHAGTAKKDKEIISSGGRVLGVTALGDTIDDAIRIVYNAVDRISWDGVYFRKDIGKKAVCKNKIPSLVGIAMGSDSDLEIMEEAANVLKKFEIPFEMTIASAHRSPAKAIEFASKAKDRGIKVIIAGAGHAAHLAGVIAAHTSLPVIGIPIDSSALKGMDSLLSTVQMPPGIPVATMAIGKSGAKNAGIMAAQILGLSNPSLSEMLESFKCEMANQIDKKDKELNKKN